MLTLAVTSSWTVILPGIMLAGIGTGLFNPAASALALRALPEEQSGLAAGASDTFRQAGIAVGIAALGTLVPSSAALGGSAEAYVSGLHNALIAAGALAILGAIATGALLIRVSARARAADYALEAA
jgi:MFS family permease